MSRANLFFREWNSSTRRAGFSALGNKHLTFFLPGVFTKRKGVNFLSLWWGGAEMGSQGPKWDGTCPWSPASKMPSLC